MLHLGFQTPRSNKSIRQVTLKNFYLFHGVWILYSDTHVIVDLTEIRSLFCYKTFNFKYSYFYFEIHTVALHYLYLQVDVIFHHAFDNSQDNFTIVSVREVWKKFFVIKSTFLLI